MCYINLSPTLYILVGLYYVNVLTNSIDGPGIYNLSILKIIYKIFAYIIYF